MKWDGPALTLAVECLGESASAVEAAERLTARLRSLGRIGSGETLKYDAIKHALKAAGMASPSAYLGQPRRYTGAKPPDFDEDAVTVPNAERPRDTDPAPPLEQPSNIVGEFAEPPDRAFIAPPPRVWPMPKTGSSRWLLVPDSHIPYHDTIAYRCMVNAAQTGWLSGMISEAQNLAGSLWDAVSAKWALADDQQYSAMGDDELGTDLLLKT